MMRKILFPFLRTLPLFLFCLPVLSVEKTAERSIRISVSENSKTIPPYEIFELTFQHRNAYKNPFFDVEIDLMFTSPSHKQYTLGGFHYGSSAGIQIKTATRDTGRGERKTFEYIPGQQDLWKARFAPNELGPWRYQYRFKNKSGQTAQGKGTFQCVKGRVHNPGFVRIHPTHPYRLVFDDGSPFFPIGLQDCWGDNSGTGSVLDQCSMEGPFRTDRQDVPPLPEGNLYVRGPSNNPQNADVYFRLFSQCGFDLYRFSQQNCSFQQFSDLDHFLVQESIMTDELLTYARKYGFRIFYGIFGYKKVFNQEPDNQEGMAKVKRFIKYTVDRWGAYVDIWEFLNEQKAHTKWYETMIPYLRSIDPYKHPITTSWERPELEGIDLNAPHWYQRENELESDAVTVSRAKKWKQHQKPVVVGEQGNWIDRKKKQPLGVGGVWDNRSALRMRIRNWTALFQEIAIIFWNTSYARDGHYMNIWLGPKEREYVHAMQAFAYALDKNVQMVPVEISHPQDIRVYGLASEKRAGVYLHHFSNHGTKTPRTKITFNIPADAKGYWYVPENASVIQIIDVNKGNQSLDVPPFQVDLALLITPGRAPDIDEDGIPNHLDPDNDNDTVPDHKDAFPLDPSEWDDNDNDWIGDNMDADDDADGIGDDMDNNGIPDWNEMDFDHDGIPRARAVPWDAFPLDPTEWLDNDGNGVGDNRDVDDDGDGWTDDEEKKAGTDPFNKLSFPLLESSP